MENPEGLTPPSPDMWNWQPIETAPLMKTIILWAATDIAEDGKILNWKMETGWKHLLDGSDFWIWDGRLLTLYDIQPTHWMPLPEPPL